MEVTVEVLYVLTITQYHKWHVLIWYLGNMDTLEQVMPSKVYPAKQTSNGRKGLNYSRPGILVPSSQGQLNISCVKQQFNNVSLATINVGLLPKKLYISCCCSANYVQKWLCVWNLGGTPAMHWILQSLASLQIIHDFLFILLAHHRSPIPCMRVSSNNMYTVQ